MTAQIYEFTGATTCELPPNKVVSYANDLKEAIVIGIDVNNELYVAGSKSDIASVVLLLEKAKLYMLNLEE